MVANNDQINFAASTINYFNLELKGGANDKLKALVRATQKTVAADIATAIKSAKSTSQTDKDKTAKDANTAAGSIADAVVVGDDPVMAAAKAWNLACGSSKIADFAETKDTDVIACNTELLKSYGFINAILKNLPNKATGVLSSTSNAFSGYATDLTKTGNEDKLKAANAYFKIAVTVTGSAPFATGDAIPEQINYSAYNGYVAKSLVQLNTISYALLQGAKCGSADKANLSDCYKAHAGDLKAIFDLANINDINGMHIDVSAKYPFDDAFKGSTDLPTVEM